MLLLVMILNYVFVFLSFYFKHLVSSLVGVDGSSSGCLAIDCSFHLRLDYFSQNYTLMHFTTHNKSENHVQSSSQHPLVHP